jgi:hypothetical protein
MRRPKGQQRVDYSGFGAAERMSALSPSAQIPPANLHIPVLGQLTPAQLSFGDGLEAGPLEVVRSDAILGGGPLREQALEHAPGTVTTPRYSPELDGLPVYSAIQRGTILTSSML